jgi:tartrate-resistant acid phosphatase type 5
MAPLLAARAAHLLLLLPAAGAFQFLSIGDWGDPAAKELNPWMGKTEPEFVIAIGDNFYSKGVTGVTDPQFETKFEQTFTAPSLNVSWYVSSGNHDYYGGETGINAEIAYSNHSSRWVFPDYYYDEEITTKDGTTILVVATDTWRINGGDTFVKYDPQTERMALRKFTLSVACDLDAF